MTDDMELEDGRHLDAGGGQREAQYAVGCGRRRGRHAPRVLLLVFVSLLWAFSFGLVKYWLHGVDSTWLSAVRLLLSWAVLLPWLRPRHAQGRQRLELMGIGAVQFGLMYLTYLASFQYLQAYQIALFTLTTPLLVCIVDDMVEVRWRWRPWAAAALSVLGSLVIVARGQPGEASLWGVLLLQCSNLCFAAGQVWYRRWRRRSARIPGDAGVFAWLYSGAVLLAVPLCLLKSPALLPILSLKQWGVVLYLGVIASGLGFFLWNVGATRVGTAALAVLNDAKIPLAVLVSLVVFGERVALLRLGVGSGLIVLAAVWGSRNERRPSADSAT